jgi:predicted nucleotidyltransferase
MMTLRDVEKTIRKHKPVLRSRFKVKKIGIFGSYVRGDAGKKSDIDILVELAEPLGLEFVDLKEYLEEILGLNVDLVTLKALKPRLRDSILREAKYT